MEAVLNEQGFKNVAPLEVGSNFECDYDEYNYGRIGKAVAHILLIPFLLAFLNIKLPMGYLVCVIFLYSTVFRSQSKEFFGVLSFVIAISAIFIIR